MEKLMLAALAACCAATPALGGEFRKIEKIRIERPTYDRTLELAAMRMVAGRIGGIRGGLTADFGPVLVAASRDREQKVDPIVTATVVRTEPATDAD